MDAQVLLPAVREVSLIVDPERPTAITQRAFDEARAQPGLPNLPRAKRIVENLNAKRRKESLTWAGVLKLAHAPEDHQVRAVSMQQADAQTWLTEQRIVDALIFVSIRVKSNGFTQQAYENEIQQMRDDGIPVDELRFPSHQQIIRALARKLHQRENALEAGLRLPRPPKKKSSTRVKAATKPVKRKQQPNSKENAWKAALEMAGLEQPERTYLPSPTVSTIALLERCFATHETQLTREEARQFAQANNIPYSLKRQELSWGESVVQWKKNLEARGSIPPPGPPPTDKRPDYSRNVGAGHPGTKVRRIGWTDIDACLVDVCAYLKQLPAGETSTFAGFRRWMQAQDRTVPSLEAFAKHGGWNRVRRLAYARIYPGLKGGSKTNEQKDQERVGKTRTIKAKSPVTERDALRATETRASTPEPRTLEPGERLRALNFRSSSPKKRRAPPQNRRSPKTRITSVQSERVRASKRSGKQPESGSRT
jgi:hypothetical protein